jgi:IS5 family transposase
MNRSCSYLWKLAIKIINRLNKLAKRHGIQQRRTYVKEVKKEYK